MTFNSLHCSISTKLNNMSLELAYFGHDKGSENFKIDTYCQEIIEYNEGNYQWFRNNYAFDDKFLYPGYREIFLLWIIYPSISYGIVVWGGALIASRSLDSITSLHNRIIVALFGSYVNSNRVDIICKNINICSNIMMQKGQLFSMRRKGPCIPKDSIVVLKESNIIGKYLYFGHRKMVEEEEMSCEWNCLTPREVGYNIKLLYPEDTEIFIHCELIEAVYFPSEKNDHEEASGVKIHQYTSLPLIHNPLPSEHFNLYRSEIYRRSNSMYGSSGNRHPAYSGYRSLSENSFYPDCRDPYLDSDDSVFGYSNGSRHFVFQ
ncbi:hypothetical protein Avbf_00795 [Armadillidium vulgare]|nr:hypothetical protein Avbf_00795 [Armadillidium vulgare]